MAVNKIKSLKIADAYIAKQNYNKALDELLTIVKVEPDDVNLLNKIGDLYSKLGKNKSAIDYFLKVAESYQQSGFNLKAIALLKKVIRLDENFMDARYRLVDLYVQQGYHSESKGELRRMAEHFFAENLFARALDCYRKLVELEPANLDARIRIAELLVREGKRDEATLEFVTMAQDLISKSMVNEARKIIGQGLRLSPDHSGLVLLQVHAQLKEGQSDEAMATLAQIVAREPQNQAALALLGQTYLSRRMFLDAKELFLRSFKISPQNTAPLEDLSRSFLEVGQVNDAYECLFPVAEKFIGLNQFDEAVRLFRSVLYVDEDHLASQEQLIQIYRETKQVKNALLILEKVINYYVDHHQEQLARARIEELLELDPNNPEWRDRLGELPHSMSFSDHEGDEIHVLDGNALDESSIIEATLEVELSDHSLGASSNDPATRLANHLTEAKVFLRYGIVDQALSQLESAKDVDFLNVEVNTMLKTLFLEKGEVKKAIPCMVSLVNACLEENDFQGAFKQIEELEEYSPEMAEIHRHRVESIADDQRPAQKASNFQDNFGSTGDQSGFDLDFGGANNPNGGSLLFDPGPEQEVVDFRDMPGSSPSLFQMDSASQEGWSLDLPSSPGIQDRGKASDLREMFDPAKLTNGTGADLPNLADINDSRFDLSLSQINLPVADEDEDLLPDFELIEELSLEEPLDSLTAHPAASTPKPAAPTPKPAAPIPTPPARAEAPPPPKPASPAPSQTPKPEVAAQRHAPLGAQQVGSLFSELEEIDFFISVEAFDDARNLIEDARRNFGEHPLLMERQRELDAKTQNVGQARASISKEPHTSVGGDDARPSGFFDLAAELSEEFFEEDLSGEVNDATSKEEIQSVEELFEEFRKGVDAQIGDEDHDTHYDLGIAYKEMGLLEESINEFTRASRDPSKFLECAIMVGTCLTELGRTEDAIAHYQEKLNSRPKDQDAILALNYELGQSFQIIGELDQALQHFRQIMNLDPDYRDVAELIEAIV